MEGVGRAGPDAEHGASWLHSKGSVVMPDFDRQNSTVSAGSYMNASLEVEERHAEKEDALVRAICNVFDSESESDDSVGPSGPRPAVKKRRCSRGDGASLSDVSQGSNQSDGSVVRLSWAKSSTTALSCSLLQAPCASGSKTLLSSSASQQDIEAGDEQRSRKQKVEWTQELHDRFVCAVEALGAKDQIPSRILDHMGSAAQARLTRQNVASHLQKYRARKRQADESPSFCRNAPAYYAPALYPCWTPHQHPLHPMPGTGWHGAPVCMAPWPGAAAAAPMIPTPLPQLPTPQDISDVIAQVLSKRKGKQHMPIGLKLDTAKVLEAANKGQHLRK